MVNIPDSRCNCLEIMAVPGSFRPKCNPNSTYQYLWCNFYWQLEFRVLDTIVWQHNRSNMAPACPPVSQHLIVDASTLNEPNQNRPICIYNLTISENCASEPLLHCTYRHLLSTRTLLGFMSRCITFPE